MQCAPFPEYQSQKKNKKTPAQLPAIPGHLFLPPNAPFSRPLSPLPIAAGEYLRSPPRPLVMSAVNITNVTVLDNPAAFLKPFQFEISYECLIPLEDGDLSLSLSFRRGFYGVFLVSFMGAGLGVYVGRKFWDGRGWSRVSKMGLIWWSFGCLLVVVLLGILLFVMRWCKFGFLRC